MNRAINYIVDRFLQCVETCSDDDDLCVLRCAESVSFDARFASAS